MTSTIRNLLLGCLLLLAMAAAAECQCTFTLSPSSASFTTAGGNQSFGITASSGSCVRNPTPDVSWITITFGQTGTGNGNASFTVDANTTYTSRTGHIIVGNAAFTVTQAGLPCSYSVSPTSQEASASGSGYSVAVTAGAGCAWTASTGTSWISLGATSGSGSGSLSYTVSPNTNYASRSGAVTVAGTPVTVTQDALPCTTVLSPTAQSVPAAGGGFSVGVTAPCSWNASTTTPWISLNANSGSGNGSVSYTVAVNSGVLRTGAISIGNQTFLVTQAASQSTSCSYTASATPASFPATGGTGQISVQTDSSCAWSVQNTVQWITMTAASSYSGNGTVNFTVTPNTSFQTRSTTLTAGGQSVTISQDASAPPSSCAVSLNPTSFSAPYTGGTGTFAVTSSGCSWSAVSNSSWISVTSGQSGNGNGTVGYSVGGNTSSQTLNGAISVGSGSFAITQAACSNYTFSPPNASFQMASASLMVSVTTPCTWTASTTSTWIHLNAGAGGAGNGSFTFTVDANTSSPLRSGSIQINDQTYQVIQSGFTCNYTVTPTSASFTAGGGQSQFVIQTGDTCSWTAQSPVSWIGSLIFNGTQATSVTGSGTLGYTVASNTAPQTRSANLTVAGLAVPVTQTGIGIQVNSVVNGASFATGPLAPGELFTIFGTGLGPSTPVGLQTTSDGQHVTTSLGNTEVLFDGTPAPLTYVSATQVNAIVPFELAGATSTKMVVQVQGTSSSATTEPVATSSPAVFPGAILNQDNSQNSALNPATVGSVLQIFATGFGQTAPAGIDALIAGATASKPVANVTATIGGLNAAVQYAGSSNGLVAGVIQVNVTVPKGVTSGIAVPLVLNVGGASSPTGTTVAIH
jgi:uncharacterized protein (TIGR03437 family)